MFSLIIESSSAQGIVALIKDHQILFNEIVPFGVRESGDLVQTLRTFLEKANLKTSQLQQIIVGIGPGSFTGLRVGACVAKALAYVHTLPIIGISSLRLFDPVQEGPFAVLLDAKMHGYCLQKGIKKEGQVLYEPLIKKLPLEQLLEEIESIPLWITADRGSLEKKLKGHINLDRLVQSSPSALQMLKEASQAPLSASKAAHELLELKYFDSPN